MLSTRTIPTIDSNKTYAQVSYAMLLVSPYLSFLCFFWCCSTARYIIIFNATVSVIALYMHVIKLLWNDEGSLPWQLDWSLRRNRASSQNIRRLSSYQVKLSRKRTLQSLSSLSDGLWAWSMNLWVWLKCLCTTLTNVSLNEHVKDAPEYLAIYLWKFK